MAENDENSLIGYDPLAWMQQTDQNSSEQADEADVINLPDSPELAVLIDTLAGSAETEVESLQMPADVAGSGSQGAVLVLEPVLNIQNVSSLYQQVLQMLNDFDAIDVDASAVTVVDTSTLQLLLILKQTALAAQKSMSIDFPSDKFVEAAGLLGIAEMLDVNQAASGLF